MNFQSVAKGIKCASKSLLKAKKKKNQKQKSSWLYQGFISDLLKYKTVRNNNFSILSLVHFFLL